jgi:protein SCO1/2
VWRWESCKNLTLRITFDPLRDTPEVLKEYVRHFDKDFIGVSGEQTQINQLIKPFGAYYEIIDYPDQPKKTMVVVCLDCK